jgi:hypothetical protein
MSNIIRVVVTLALAVAALVLWLQGDLVQVPAAVIRWSTESEVDTLGFHVYRATNEIGPYERVSEELITSSGDPFTGGSYTFTDATVEPDRTYYYQLEELETSGSFARLNETVPFESRAEPNWTLLSILLALLLLIWFFPLPGRRATPSSETRP